MRSRFLTALFSLISVTAFAGAPADFLTANAAYAEGRFADARDAYQKIVEGGEYSANLFYNLGNTWHRLEQPGQAVLAYERALALAPAHANARANVDLIRQTTGARVPAEPGWMRYYPTLGANAYFWIATIAVWVLVFALATRLLGLARPRLVYPTAAGALVLGLLCAPMLARQLASEKAAVVVSADALARYAPTSSGATAAKLPAGSLIRLLAIRGDWAYAESPDAQNLWIPTSDIAPVRL